VNASNSIGEILNVIVIAGVAMFFPMAAFMAIFGA